MGYLNILKGTPLQLCGAVAGNQPRIQLDRVSDTLKTLQMLRNAGVQGRYHTPYTKIRVRWGDAAPKRRYEREKGAEVHLSATFLGLEMDPCLGRGFARKMRKEEAQNSSNPNGARKAKKLRLQKHIFTFIEGGKKGR